jgi:hypothetical protein
MPRVDDVAVRGQVNASGTPLIAGNRVAEALGEILHARRI